LTGNEDGLREFLTKEHNMYGWNIMAEEWIDLVETACKQNWRA
jgi:hypothetical protein